MDTKALKTFSPGNFRSRMAVSNAPDWLMKPTDLAGPSLAKWHSAR